jgi:hypothetical protein
MSVKLATGLSRWVAIKSNIPQSTIIRLVIKIGFGNFNSTLKYLILSMVIWLHLTLGVLPVKVVNLLIWLQQFFTLSGNFL